ncbi:MAG: hypothetical protein R3240_11040 [Gammaproteobacteria bacterium]|nr:hypothetical protein [Gammaproteobacteria bacterium]
MDTLVDRLRGNYEIGPNAEFGKRDFSSFIPPICIEAAQEIERLTQENEALQNRFDELKAIYVKLTNSEHVVNDFGEIVGYVATHNILHEIEKLVEQSNEDRD